MIFLVPNIQKKNFFFRLQVALDIAQKEFPEELSEISRDRISLYVGTVDRPGRPAVRISSAAWESMVETFKDYANIHIKVKPLSKSAKLAGQAPPRYVEKAQNLDSDSDAFAAAAPRRSMSGMPSLFRRVWKREA